MTRRSAAACISSKIGAQGGSRHERSSTEVSGREDLGRPRVRRRLAQCRRRLTRCDGARDRQQTHQCRQCVGRRHPQSRRRGQGRAARLGGDAVRGARRRAAQGRPRARRQSGRTDPVDRPRNRRHSGKSRVRNPHGDGNPLSLVGDVHRAAGSGAAVQSGAHQHRPARAAGRRSASSRRSTSRSFSRPERWRRRWRPGTASFSSPIRAPP